jgi:hypothetical protein
VAEKEESVLSNVGDFLPTFLVLFVLSMSWGFIHYADGDPWLALSIAPPLAIGMLSSASVRMMLGRQVGDVITVTLAGVCLFLVMTAFATVVAWLLYGSDGNGGLPLDVAHLLLSVGIGMIGASVGSFALGHYALGKQEAETGSEGEWNSALEAREVDYSTEPSNLLCLITNQAVDPRRDEYVVCHNPLNVSSTCHAVYLMKHVQVLNGRCNRCYKPFLKRDLRGMRRRKKA